MTKPTDPVLAPFALMSAAQAATLDLLRAELCALSTMMPGHAPADPADAEAREAQHSADFEADFDDMPV